MLTAVMEYADRSDAPAIVALAEKLDNFRFLPNAGDMDDVGRWFVESNREYNLHEDLQEYYDLKDVSNAVFRADRKSGLRLDTREELFTAALEGKELDVYEEETQDEDVSPAMQM